MSGASHEHPTDSLSAAFNYLAKRGRLTHRCEKLCELYGIGATLGDPGAFHENCSIESRRRTIQHALEQGLLRPGRREFNALADYRQFVAEGDARMNVRLIKALAVERPVCSGCRLGRKMTGKRSWRESASTGSQTK